MFSITNVCCVCLETSCNTELTQNDDNKNPIVSKLRCIVPEVEWNDESKICLQCLELVLKFAEFKKLCLESHLKLNQKDGIKTENGEEYSSLEPIISIKSEVNSSVNQVSEASSSADAFFDEFSPPKRKKTSHTKNDNKGEQITPKINERRPKKRYPCTAPCRQVFQTENQLKKHKKTCQGILTPLKTCVSNLDQSSYRCNKCGRRFTSEQVLSEHTRMCICASINRSEVRSQCPICKRVFGDTNSLKNHITTLHLINIDVVNMCQVCFAQFDSAQDLNAHVHTSEEVANVTFSKCKSCESAFSTNAELSRHVFSEHNAIWEGKASCEVCYEVFNSGKEAISHYACAHGISSSLLVRPFLCPHCPGRYIGMGIKAHIRSHLVDKTHFEVKYRCEACVEIFNSARQLEIHFKNNHNPEKKETIHPFTCRYCPTKITSLQGLFIHTQKQHLIPKKSEKAPSLNLNQPLINCETCLLNFPSPKEVLDHSASIHNLEVSTVTTYGCPHCPRRFFELDPFNEHIATYFKLEEKLQFVCSTCGKAFNSKQYLKIHEESQHLNISNICDRCGKKFKKKQALSNHNRVHHPDGLPEEKIIKCSHCDKTFADNSDLTRHLNRINGIKTHECPTCFMKFVTISEQKRHFRIHSTDPASKFKCTECPKLFNSKQLMKRHLKKDHNLGDARIVSNYQKKRNFVCHLCPKAFIDNRSLQKHLNSHLGVKPYACQMCSKSFSNKDYVKTHMLKEHNFKTP